MNDDAADLESLRKAHVLPGLAAVRRFVDAVAVRDRVARVILARADPDNVAVGRRDADVADGDGRLTVELMFKGDAVVNGLDQPAGGCCHPVGGRIRLEDGNGRDAAAHVGRADRAPGQGLDPLGRNGSVGQERSCLGRRLAKFLQPLGQGLDLFFQIGQLLFATLLFRIGRRAVHTENGARGQRQSQDQAAKRGGTAQHETNPRCRTKVAKLLMGHA